MTSESTVAKREKVALITGANKGIGREIARQLGQLGYTALLGAREERRGQSAAQQLCDEGLNVLFVPLDVTILETIDAAAAFVQERFGYLDALVNNAAIALDNAPPSQLQIDILRRTLETNVLGVFAVTQAMLPLLRRSEAGRIVNLSSGAGSMTLTGSPQWRSEWLSLAYSASKAAVNSMTVNFATELRGTPIKINCVNPGYVATDMSPQGERTVEEGARGAVRLATLPDDGPSGGFFYEEQTVPW